MAEVVANVPGKETLIIGRLMNPDRELHSIIGELKGVKGHEKLSLSELNKIMEKDRILAADSTKLIREMRDKEYGI